MSIEQMEKLQEEPFYIVIEHLNEKDQFGYEGYVICKTWDYKDAKKHYDADPRNRHIQKWQYGRGEWMS